MTAAASTFGWSVRWCLRLLLSGLFMYAGAVKMRDARAFVESVASFRLIPDLFAVPVALTLPPLEILAGLLALSAGRWRRVGALCLVSLLAIFTVALASALVRGLQVDCGCFGPDRLDLLSPTKNLWSALIRDAVLGAVAGFLYVDSRSVQKRRPGSVQAADGAGN